MPQERPVVVFVAGQPGAGKTRVADLIQAALGQRGGAVRTDFHVLRHTYAASIILEAGESVVTLARWLGHSSPTITLGHSSPTITLDHYAHFMPEAGGKGRAAVDALLGAVPAYVPENMALA
uniref:zeta toxin family protein n=1 Tax=Streptomyces sp. CB02009 TaxID=1703938 RepID=UPI00093E5CD2|nr:zeta toxin family protein [Streptomyces sp. CB02009]